VNAAVPLVVAAVLDPKKKAVLVDVAKPVAEVLDLIVPHVVRMLQNQKDLALEHQDVRNLLAIARAQDAPEKTNLGLLIFY
jgi:hypothetical protein